MPLDGDLIWTILSQQFCSFKRTMKGAGRVGNMGKFCRNVYNVTGICSHFSCPLANGNYATVREEEGKVYLCIKEIERTNFPSKTWEKIVLPGKFASALQEIDYQLAHWDVGLVHKIKQRLLKLHQYMLRVKKYRSKPQAKLITIKHTDELRESRRESRALRMAKIENVVKAELLERLKKDTYGDMYNIPHKEFVSVLKENSEKDELPFAVADSDEESDLEDENENENENEYEYEMEEETVGGAGSAGIELEIDDDGNVIGDIENVPYELTEEDLALSFAEHSMNASAPQARPDVASEKKEYQPSKKTLAKKRNEEFYSKSTSDYSGADKILRKVVTDEEKHAVDLEYLSKRRTRAFKRTINDPLGEKRGKTRPRIEVEHEHEPAITNAEW